MITTRFPAEALYVCDSCLGPLEATYDYKAVQAAMSRETIASRPPNPGNLGRAFSSSTRFLMEMATAAALVMAATR